MLRKIFFLALTYSILNKVYRNAVAKARSEMTVVPEPLHTWEDEGGALHPSAH